MQDNTKICPVHIKALERPACMQTLAGIAYCEVCGAAKCPVCGRHNVIQLSRVTGYVGAVNGWNEAKKHELKDRKRYNIGGRS
jgi:anaerobic ribonucleoside-triphosphate reductase